VGLQLTDKSRKVLSDQCLAKSPAVAGDSPANVRRLSAVCKISGDWLNHPGAHPPFRVCALEPCMGGSGNVSGSGGGAGLGSGAGTATQPAAADAAAQPGPPTGTVSCACPSGCTSAAAAVTRKSSGSAPPAANKSGARLEGLPQAKPSCRTHASTFAVTPCTLMAGRSSHIESTAGSHGLP
jgi:hypothetical protein